MVKYIVQILTLLLTILLIFINTFVAKTIDFYLPLIVLIVVLGINLILVGYKKPLKRDFIYNLIFVVGLTFLLQCIFYLAASKTGFLKNYNSIFRANANANNFLIILLIALLREILRYIVVNTKVDKKYQIVILNILMVILGVIIDIRIDTRVISFAVFTVLFEFLTMSVIDNIAKNMLLNYLCKDNGFIIPFLYVLIMDLYIYLMPVIPEVNQLIKAVILLVFPYFVFCFYKKFTERRSLEKKPKNSKFKKVINAISIIVFAILVCLVSREFKYSMIGVGSGSMTGTINKGDAIIYRRYEGNENLKDKVIVFKKNSVLIVHRVIRTFVLDEGRVYLTKGDNNERVDDWLVDDSEVVGIVEYRIKFIAWPSVWLGELL